MKDLSPNYNFLEVTIKLLPVADFLARNSGRFFERYDCLHMTRGSPSVK
jgi:hypothetical protein